jgi:murein DD-endopeptidase MepM/ murein hydrolase activator NlpD
MAVGRGESQAVKRAWVAALAAWGGAVFGLDLVLPTDNDALYRGGGSAFYQHVDRTFRGEKTTPWEAGQFGYVRDPREAPAGPVMRKFHEGIDIRPVRRDGRGFPLDAVRAIGAGRVAHVSLAPGASNYGRYVVVEHRWDGMPYYSLYAHLASIAVAPGAPVGKGQRLGLLGWSGEGLDLARAHLHLEIALLLSEDYEAWHARCFPTEPNKHGLYSGLNLAGIDPAKLFLALRAGGEVTVPSIVARERPVFKVRVPRSARLGLLERYPWLAAKGGGGGASWEIAFSGSGLPLSVSGSDRPSAGAELVWLEKRPISPAWYTRNYVGGTAEAPRLTPTGARYVELVAGFGAAAGAAP